MCNIFMSVCQGSLEKEAQGLNRTHLDKERLNKKIKVHTHTPYTHIHTHTHTHTVHTPYTHTHTQTIHTSYTHTHKILTPHTHTHTHTHTHCTTTHTHIHTQTPYTPAHTVLTHHTYTHRKPTTMRRPLNFLSCCCSSQQLKTLSFHNETALLPSEGPTDGVEKAAHCTHTAKRTSKVGSLEQSLTLFLGHLLAGPHITANHINLTIRID